MARDNKNTGKGMTSRTRATSRVDLVPNTGTGPFGSIGSPKGSRGANSNPKSQGKGNYPTVEANYRKPGKPLAKKAAAKAPAPSKRVTSKNYETGKTNLPSGVRVGPGGAMTGKYYTSTNKKGVVTGIGVQRNTNYKVAPKKKK